MTKSKYTFTKLRKHTESIRAQSTVIMQKHIPDIEKAFADFSDYMDDLEHQPKTLECNVKRILSVNLLNHVYSALILVESGLIVDAIICGRNALETIAFHWLVCLDPNAAEEYNQGEKLLPFKVRKRLVEIGVDINSIRELYASYSDISHVGRRAERFHIKWESISDGVLFPGGNYTPDDIAEMFSFLSAILYLFVEPIMCDLD